MAKVQKNIVISGLSGSLGDQLVIQMGKGGQTIIRTMPRPSNQPPSAAQSEARQRFQAATAYAKQAQETPIYGEKAAGTPQTSYNVAVADWFHPPEVAEVDLAAWTGGLGETLRALVRDDAQVKSVHFVIAQEDGTLVEEGAGVPAEGLWWEYVTTVDHPGGAATVLVTAQDLPGHEASHAADKNVV